MRRIALHFLWAFLFRSIPKDFGIESSRLRSRTGVYRVMMLGDSTTFGWGVKEEDTAAKFLERKLNADLPAGYNRVEVMNTGVGNYDTVQEVTYYETFGWKYHPDLVVLVFFINDPEPVPIRKERVSH